MGNDKMRFTDRDAIGVVRAFWRRIHPYIYEPNEPPYPKEFGENVPVEFQAHMATALCAIHDAYQRSEISSLEIKAKAIFDRCLDQPDDMKYIRNSLKSLISDIQSMTENDQ